jgi:hypothetical protein
MKTVIKIARWFNIAVGPLLLLLLLVGSIYQDSRTALTGTYFIAFGLFACPLMLKLIDSENERTK